MDVHRIGTKENVLADALSRGAIQEFHAHAARFINGPGVSLDTEDWQMSPDVFDYFDRWLGPFQYDACVDKYRTNSHCPRSWTAGDDCRRQRWHGLTVWCNGPFSRLRTIFSCTSCGARRRSRWARRLCSSSPFGCPRTS